MTVPYQGDMANPMVTAETGPGKAGYIIGTILIMVGVVGGIAWLVIGITGIEDTVDDMEREPVDQVGTIDLDEGGQVIYGESAGGDAVSAVLGTVRIRPEGEEGGELNVSTYEGELTYDFGNRPMRAQYTVDIPEDGTYEIRAAGIPGGATTVTVGPSIAGDLVGAILGGFIIGGLGVLIGVILLIVTGVRRRRFRQRSWQGGWSAPGSWNPQANAGYGGTPQQPGGWNPPPPPTGFPPGGNYPPPPG